MRYLILCWMLIPTLAGATTPGPRIRDLSFPLGAPRVLSATYAEGDALHAGLAQPTALASADFDEDGIEDLICGYATGQGGTVALHRGNIDAIFPYSNEARERRLQGTFVDEPFLSPARTFDLPVTPDFLGAGDFDADGHWDVVAAAKAEAGLYLMSGDGHGGLERVRRIPLPGPVTALVAGEVNRANGLTDLAVGVRMPKAFAVLVFEGPDGALRSPPEKIALSSEPTALLFARVLGGPWWDLAIAAADELLIVTGRDRRLVLDEPQRAEVAPPAVDRIEMPSAIEALAWGDFAWEAIATRELALLLEDGTIRLLGRAHATDESPNLSWDTIGEREVLVPRTAAGASSSVRQLLPVRISGSPTEDLAILDAVDGRLDILAGMVREDATANLADPGVVVSVDMPEPPIAALGMRLNRDALTDLVLLRQGVGGPLVVETALLATITVNTAADSTATDGTCSLREALNNSNSDSDTTGGDCVAGAGADTIEFNIGGGGSTAAIAPTSALPTITDPVTIDGTTQGCASSPCVVLDGSGAGFVVAGLNLAAGSSSIRGLVIHLFLGDPGDSTVNGYGIFITSSGNIIEGNYSGTDVTGTVDLGNDGASLRIEDGSNNTVGGAAAGAGNLLSGAGANGLVITQVAGTASGNQVLGNLIGTDATGTEVLGNAAAGVRIKSASGNIVGGASPGAGNIISANATNGVSLDTGATGNQILGNFIGTDVTGTMWLGNGSRGVSCVSGASNNLVGGASPGAGNLISANGFYGVHLNGVNVTGNQLLGNRIGTDITGMLVRGNFIGVLIQEASNNTIGGTSAGARNIISGNLWQGIFITIPAEGNQLLGNFIGTDVTGTGALPNLIGIEVDTGTFNNEIGGTADGAGNVISGNEQGGILLQGAQNSVRGNLIGTDVTGTVGLGNGTFSGVEVWGPNNTIGGTSAGARNIISGNDPAGIFMISNGATGNEVLGNYIGTQIDGTSPLGNAQHGVLLDGVSNNAIGGTGVTPGLCDGPCNRIGCVRPRRRRRRDARRA